MAALVAEAQALTPEGFDIPYLGPPRRADGTLVYPRFQHADGLWRDQFGYRNDEWVRINAFLYISERRAP